MNQPDVHNEAICLCREVDKNSGNIAVYPINSPVTDKLLMLLGIRARMNPELRYFTTLTVRWDKYQDEITKLLKRKNLTPRVLEAYGGIVEL